jgi:hypothetical protein
MFHVYTPNQKHRRVVMNKRMPQYSTYIQYSKTSLIRSNWNGEQVIRINEANDSPK